MVSTKAVAKSPFETASDSSWPTVSTSAPPATTKTASAVLVSTASRRRSEAVNETELHATTDGDAWTSASPTARPRSSVYSASSNSSTTAALTSCRFKLGACVGEPDGAAVGLAEGAAVVGFAEGDGVGPAVGRADVGDGDGPGVVGAGSEDGAAVPRSSVPAQFVPEPVPAGAGPAALSVAVASHGGASSPESAQQLSSIVVKSTSTLYNVPSLPATWTPSSNANAASKTTPGNALLGESAAWPVKSALTTIRDAAPSATPTK
mmetsp:Transcript_7213/g.18751  ORF Transcript_7213/g.18751 Transcript_7213/m.18751 type:complete len:264 (+) Transcript_7213:823-1614(+)